MSKQCCYDVYFVVRVIENNLFLFTMAIGYGHLCFYSSVWTISLLNRLWFMVNSNTKFKLLQAYNSYWYSSEKNSGID